MASADRMESGPRSGLVVMVALMSIGISATTPRAHGACILTRECAR